MIPLTLACLIGGCLDIPIDTRSIPRQIWEDQINVERTKEICDENPYTGRRDPRSRDCGV